MRSRLLVALVPVTFAYARLSGGALAYYLFYFFLFLVVLSYYWTWRSGRSTTVIYETSNRTVERGDDLEITVRIENEGLLPIPWMRLTDHTFERRELESIQLAGMYSFTGFRTRLVRYSLRAERRGHYTLGPLRANYGDPFGVFEAVQDFRGRRDILVYPRFTPLSYLPLPLRQPFGHVRTRQHAYEDPTELAELRPMRTGDNPKRIHWKTTARLGEPYVRVPELKATADLVLVLDLNAHAHVWDGTDSTLEKAVETAAAVGHYCLKTGYRTQFMGRAPQSWDMTLRPGHQGFTQLMELLARADSGKGPRLVELLSPERMSLPPRSTLLVVTADTDASLAETLLRLKNRGYGVVLFFVHPEGYLGEAVPRAVRLRVDRLHRLADEGVPTFVIDRDEELAALTDHRRPRSQDVAATTRRRLI